MDDGSTYSIKNDGLMQGPIIGGQGHHITQHYHAADSKATAPEQAWNVPYQRNPYFTGREDLLARLHEQLHAGQDIALSQAISGLGGVGKTQLAVEYAYRYREEYGYILWARAESEESLISSYAALADELNLPQKDEQDQNKVVEAVKRWLRNNDGWLLIFDNADEPGILSQYVPTSPRGYCLYTTRASTLGRLAHCLPVESFSDEQGALFLLRRTQLLALDASLEQANEQERELALRITRELGGLPLALDQAGAYIEEAQTSLADYLKLYQQRRAELLAERGDLVIDHPEPVATTWSLSFERVAQRNPDAIDLLGFLAFVAPEDIPEEIMIGGSTYLGEVIFPVAADDYQLDKALKALLAYSFIKRDRKEQTLSIHRLVQAVVRDSMSFDNRNKCATWVMLVVTAALPDVTTYVNWKTWERCLPHALMCVEWIKHDQLYFPMSISLLNKIGYYMNARARFGEAELIQWQLLEICEQVWGTENEDTAQILNNLSGIYWAQGRYKDAESLAKRALAIYEQLGSEPLEMASCLNYLARCYMEQQKYEDAKPLMQKALTIYEEASDPPLNEMAQCLNNLGLLCDEIGSYKEANTFSRRALEIRERILGPKDPEIAQSLNNLGALCLEQGWQEEAEPLLRRAFAIREEVLGEMHPDTAQSLNNLSSLYNAQGRYELMEPLLLRALAINEALLGQNNIETAKTLNNLAAFYKGQGRYDEADLFYKRTLTICEETFDAEHILTVTAKYNYLELQLMMEKNVPSRQTLSQEKLRGKQKKKARQRENRSKQQ